MGHAVPEPAADTTPERSAVGLQSYVAFEGADRGLRTNDAVFVPQDSALVVEENVFYPNLSGISPSVSATDVGTFSLELHEDGDTSTWMLGDPVPALPVALASEGGRLFRSGVARIVTAYNVIPDEEGELELELCLGPACIVFQGEIEGLDCS